MLSGKWDRAGSSGTRVCPGWAAYLCVAGSMVRGSPSWPTETIRDKAGPVLSHTGHVGSIFNLYLGNGKIQLTQSRQVSMSLGTTDGAYA